MKRTYLIAALFGAVTCSVLGNPNTDRLKSTNKAYRREIRTDYDTIPGKVIHLYNDGTAKTNVPFHVDCHVVTNCYELTLENEKKVANYVRKAQKDAEKAEKKDAKNFEGWLKDTKKAMDKSSEDMRPFYEDIIFFATNRAEKAVLNTDKEGK